MFPAILPAIKAWSLTTKILVPIGIVVALYCAKWGYDEYQQSVGFSEAELAHEIDLRQQTQDALVQTSKENDIKTRNVEELIQIASDLESRLASVKQERDRYEKLATSKKPLDHDAVRIVNEFDRVLNQAPTPTERTPDASETTGEPSPAPQTCATTADLVRRNTELAEREAITWLRHAQLWEYEQEQYEARMKFYNDVQTELDRLKPD